ncbi:MAG: hypothetical protein ACRD1C_00500 [Terriglobales bacterium]
MPAPGAVRTATQAAGSRRERMAALVRMGLLAGSFDIGENIIFNAFRGITPAMIFRYIASGALGSGTAARWGWMAVGLGVVCHYGIATVWTVAFYAASRRMRFLLRRPLLWGPLYGAIVYVFMTYVVLPLSRVPRLGPTPLATRISLILASLFCVGYAIALLVARDARLTE